MSLYTKWEELAEKERTQTEYDEFWKEYLEKESALYVNILENKDSVISGKLSEVGEKFNMDPVTFAGFVSGINTSLLNPMDLDNLQEDSQVSFEVDFEKLFFNMLEAQADWLYSLPQWDGVLSIEKRKEIAKTFNASRTVVKGDKIGRNDKCPCGSGKKYKKCCG
jgi:preprotein translocase subunit SecA